MYHGAFRSSFQYYNHCYIMYIDIFTFSTTAQYVMTVSKYFGRCCTTIFNNAGPARTLMAAGCGITRSLQPGAGYHPSLSHLSDNSILHLRFQVNLLMFIYFLFSFLLLFFHFHFGFDITAQENLTVCCCTARLNSADWFQSDPCCCWLLGCAHLSDNSILNLGLHIFHSGQACAADEVLLQVCC